MRWQTGETRSTRVWLDTGDGLPLTGAQPLARALHGQTGQELPAPTVSELGLGFYRLTLAAPVAHDVVVLVDLGAGRYVPLEVQVGGYVDQLDVPTSSRASQIAVTALSDALTALDAAVGTPAQSVALDAAHAALDALVRTRATAQDLAVTVQAPRLVTGAVGP